MTINGSQRQRRMAVSPWARRTRRVGVVGVGLRRRHGPEGLGQVRVRGLADEGGATITPLPLCFVYEIAMEDRRCMENNRAALVHRREPLGLREGEDLRVRRERRLVTMRLAPRCLV